MTALHPIEAKIQVVGVVAARYPINETCAHPLCDEPTETRHHIFARSKTGSGSWFVSLDPKKVTRLGDKHRFATEAIPHVVGLCGTGSTKHHGDLEDHRAWVKMMPDGTFVWFERDGEEWKEVGPLDPQPGARIKHRRPKKRDHRSDGNPRARSRYTFAVPQDEQEEGADLIDDALKIIESKLGHDPPRSKYYTLLDGLNFAVINMDSTDV